MISLLTNFLTHPAVVHTTILRTDDYGYDYGSDEGGAWFWLLGPVGGIGFYMWVFLRYRNTDKRHAYEHESATELRDMRTHDQRVNRVRGTSSSRIDGRNSHKPLTRLGAGTTIVELPAPKPLIEEVLAPATDTPQGGNAESANGANGASNESTGPAAAPQEPPAPPQG